jgi:surfeit locus 1 family protein
MDKSFSVLTFFSKRWWWVTLVVIAGIFLLARLGFWQLDRLEERRGENVVLAAQLAKDAINLNEETDSSLLAFSDNLQFRQVTVTGTYDHAEQVFLIQRSFRGMPGRHLITPLKIQGSDQVILVDRGWTPNNNDGNYPDYPRFAELGTATVTGYLKESEKLPNGLTSPIPESAQTDWFRVEIPAIQAQMPYELLPYYLLALPDDGLPVGSGNLPYREPPTFDLSEGSHLSYAIQWFIFMTMLGGGYIYFVWQQTRGADESS